MPLLLAGAFNAQEDLAALPNPMYQRWTLLDPTAADRYLQTLDMRTGVLTTSWKQPSLVVKCQIAVSPTKAVIAQRWDIETADTTPLEFSEIQAGVNISSIGSESTPAVRAFSIELLGGLARGLSYLRMPGGQDFGCLDLHVQGMAGAHRQITFEQIWDFAPNETWERVPSTFESVRDQSASTWADRWKTDIVLDGPAEDQQAIHSWLFYLRAGLSSGLWPAWNPMGLSNNLYKGHIFWDSDIWMFPAICLIDPQTASTIANYRIDNKAAAESNSGGPHRLRYPWESALTGRELAPRDLRNAQHATGDVAFMLAQAQSLALADPKHVDEIEQEASNYYQGIASNGGRFLHLRGVRGPDEYHVGDDDLYTNALAEWLAQDTGPGGRKGYFLPHDSKSLLTYDGDPVRNYGQADAILAIYPLQNRTAEAEASTMMDRFPGKTNPSSPAMTNSVQSLILARLGNAQEAYQEWEKSWRDFMAHPLGLFGEQRKKDKTYFQTGAAGCLQAVLYGFLGFRIDWQKSEKAALQFKLNAGRWLTIKPHLPDQWNRVSFKNFSLLGKHYTLTVTHHGATVTQGEP